MGRRATPWMRSDTGVWYAWHAGRQASLKLDGRLIRGADRQADAMKAFHRLKAESEAAQVAPAAMSLAELATVFLDHSRRHNEPGTAYTYRRYAVQFVKATGQDMPAAEVRPLHVSRWLDGHRWGQNTRASAAGVIVTMFAWAAREGRLESNPIERMGRVGHVRRERILSAEQGRAALAACECPEFRDVLVALRETGCRPNEAYTLAIDRVDLDNGTWKVIDKIRGKTGEQFRTVYLSPEMIELTARLIDGRSDGPVFRNTKGKNWNTAAAWFQFQKIKARLGYGQEAILYSYRYLYITDALERGVPPATVAQLVGHRDLKMIMRIYSRLADRTAHLRAAAATARTAPVKKSTPTYQSSRKSAASAASPPGARLAKRKTKRPARSRKPRTT